MASSLSAGATAQIPPRFPVSAVSPNAGSNVDTIYTVPTGFTFYCTGAILFNTNNVIANYVIQVGVTNVLAVSVDQDQTVNVAGYPVFSAPSGSIITMNNTVGHNNNQGTIWGFLL